MTVVEKMARAMAVHARAPEDIGWRIYAGHARAGLTSLHDSFADPVVRAAIQAALDEKEG